MVAVLDRFRDDVSRYDFYLLVRCLSKMRVCCRKMPSMISRESELIWFAPI